MDPLEQMARDLEGLADVAPRVAARAAPGVLAAARADWMAGRSPTGAAWPPLARGGGVPLAGLTSQGTVLVEGAAVIVRLPDLARPHQAGTERDPRRQLVPSEGEALPASYRAALDAAVVAEIGGAG